MEESRFNLRPMGVLRRWLSVFFQGDVDIRVVAVSYQN